MAGVPYRENQRFADVSIVFVRWLVVCRGTSLTRNSAPLGPYSRNMPRALWKS